MPLARPVSVAIALAILATGGACSRSASPEIAAGAWRSRLRAVLYERTAKNGSRWGRDRLDPLLCRDTEHLLAGPSHAAALAILDELTAALDRGLSLSAVERALIQRDLFAVHDWAVEPFARGEPASHPAERKALADRLAAAMRGLALDTDAIAALPDPLAATAAARRHPTSWDAKEPLRPFLPSDLLDAKAPWVCLGDANASLTPVHRGRARAHAAFVVLARTPDGREETKAWVATAAAELAKHDGADQWTFGPSLPDPPATTQVAVVRRAILVDVDGRAHASPLVEQVELRVLGANARVQGPNGQVADGQPAPFLWELDATRLLRGDPAALVPVDLSRLDFPFFEQGHGGDLFEQPDEFGRFPQPTPTLESCIACHGFGGADVLTSLTHGTGPSGPLPAHLFASSAERETERSAGWADASAELGILRRAFAR